MVLTERVRYNGSFCLKGLNGTERTSGLLVLVGATLLDIETRER